jgi:hypothetical protein
VFPAGFTGAAGRTAWIPRFPLLLFVHRSQPIFIAKDFCRQRAPVNFSCLLSAPIQAPVSDFFAAPSSRLCAARLGFVIDAALLVS